jgi:hypothetical protein
MFVSFSLSGFRIPLVPFGALLAVLSLFHGIDGQHGDPNAREALENQATIHVRIISDQLSDLRADLGDLRAIDRAYFASKTARLIGKTDPARADEMASLAKASILSGVKDADKVSRIDVFRLSGAVDDLIALDPASAIAVVSNILKLIEDRGATFNSGDGNLSDLLVALAEKTADREPALAERLILASLRDGFSDSLPSAIITLLRYSPERGTKALEIVVTKTRNNFADRSARTLFNLDRFGSEFSGGRPLSDRDQKLILATFSSNMIDAAGIPDLRPNRCGMAFYGVSLRERIRNILPQTRLAFEQSVDICIPYLSSRVRNLSTAGDDFDKEKPGSEIIEKAKNEKDTDKKIELYRLGFSKLRVRKEFSRMISLLDGFEGEDFRKVSEQGWRSWRITASVNATLSALQERDTPSAYKILSTTPSNLRPLARHRLLRSEKADLSQQFWSDCLDALETELDKSVLPDGEAAAIYIDLIDLRFGTDPVHGLSLFEKAVRFINKAEALPSETDYGFSWGDAAFPGLKFDLLVYNEIAIDQAVKDVSTAVSRVRLRLGLLNASLSEYVKLRVRLDLARQK